MRFEIDGCDDDFRTRDEAGGAYVFFFDFDNTLTSFDVLDDVIAKFSVSEEWKALEKDWQEGKIGSRRCLEGQIACIRISREKLQKYLAGIKIDPYFKKLLALLQRRKIEASIISDSFSFFIREILKRNGIKCSAIGLCANEILFENDRFIPSFPHENKNCPDCAHCKKQHVCQGVGHGKKVVYIGDGRSDFCAAMESDLVFAKGALLEYLRSEGKPCMAFDNFRSVYISVKQLLGPKLGMRPHLCSPLKATESTPPGAP
jgi:2,3-diketo-5-methylthio-1-phosphopentane phosphatase